jgi:glycerol-3-phosphate acyltransferase PlsX
MWSALQAVKAGESPVVISCGNTGALMALAMLALRKAPGIDRPAIAVLWPSLNTQGYNVLLDAGADIRADSDDLLKFAVMGASYARNALGLTRPRVGLLNVGTEEHKGRSELHEAAELIGATAPTSDFEYIGYVEGVDMPSDRVDVVVTDGFTGNVALKTGEGTARRIQGLLKEAFSSSSLSRIGALFALTSLKRLQKRIDPRRANGGVFLGLNGTVIKSHGAADATGVSAAIKLAFTLAEHGFNQRLAARVAFGPAEHGADVARGGAPT